MLEEWQGMSLRVPLKDKIDEILKGMSLRALLKDKTDEE